MESASRTLVCSVLFLDIVEYSKKPVAEQLQLKQSFNRALAGALAPVAARDRVILDTGDGAAVTFLGDPEQALFAAIALRDARGVPPTRLGINLGPVRLVRDLNGQINIIGDGINVAQRVMSFAQPGQLLVSRSFFEVVSCLSRDFAGLFRHEGSRTDKHVREHEVYSVGATTGAMRRAAESTRPRGEAAQPRWFARPGPAGFARSALLAAPLAFLLLAAGGVIVRAALRQPETVATAAPPAPAARPAPDPAAKPRSEALAERLEAIRVERLAAAKAEHERLVAAGVNPGRIVVAVAPWGEVFIDGRSRGKSPPLQVAVLPPGPHVVEIRNPSFPAHVERVMVKPGEPVKIHHRFN
jgi:class 3 adenylate cyclase